MPSLETCVQRISNAGHVVAVFVVSGGSTYVPDRKRKIILQQQDHHQSVQWFPHRLEVGRYTHTSACGNRTLAPYTAPLRAVLMNDRRSWYRGSWTISSSAVCYFQGSAWASSPSLGSGRISRTFSPSSDSRVNAMMPRQPTRKQTQTQTQATQGGYKASQGGREAMNGRAYLIGCKESGAAAEKVRKRLMVMEFEFEAVEILIGT